MVPKMAGCAAKGLIWHPGEGECLPASTVYCDELLAGAAFFVGWEEATRGPLPESFGGQLKEERKT